jgi:UDP-2,4-diacetamido-2,4,6-trideoxy-beta-L-altropyranose hydrolase
MTAPVIVFRTDATPKVALGHLRRCLALAEALRQEGCEAVFYCFDDPAARAALSDGRFRSHFMSHEVGTDEDTNNMVEILKQVRPALVIVDSYAADERYLAALRAKTPAVGCFDDLGWAECPADIVINGLVGAEVIPYRAPLALLGPQYLILALDYWECPPATPRERVRSVLVTMGGIDHYDLSSLLIGLIGRADRTIRIDIVIGPYYENQERVQAAKESYGGNVVLHQTPATLGPLMRESDLAISAGGFTLYELAAVGVPTIGIALWDNQRGNVTALGELNAILPLIYDNSAVFDERLGGSIDGLIKDAAGRHEMAAAGQAMVDGCGACRAAQAIVSNIKQSVEAV